MQIEPAPRPLIHRLYAAGFRAIHGLGLDRHLGSLTRGRGVVLAFHHVRPWRPAAFAPNRFLEIEPSFLEAILDALQAEGFEVIALDALPGRLASGGKPFAALTFDDGYRDVIEYAWPILRRRGVPWAMFVTEAFACGRGRLWWRELELAVARLNGIPSVVSGSCDWIESEGPAAKARAYAQLYAEITQADEATLLRRTARLVRAAGIELDKIVPCLCADWDELRELANDPAVTFGSHTLSHAILAKCDEAKARSEIARSLHVISRRLGRPIAHIAYPHGGPRQVGPREFALAAASGYATGFTTRPGHVRARHGSGLTALPRISVNGHHQSAAALQSMLSGVPFLAHEFARALREGSPRESPNGTDPRTA